MIFLERITPVVLTYDEEPNIHRTLANLTWARRVVVLDSFSEDATANISRSFPNVDFRQRAFDTHANQWNYGLSLVETEWVLSLDADYVIPAEMEIEMGRLTPTSEISGYEAHFRYCIHGRPLRASVYPPRTVLFRTQCCSYYDDGHTQRLRADGVIRLLNGVIDHDDRKPLSRWIRSQDRYTILETRHLMDRAVTQLTRQDRLRRKVYFAPVMMFLYLLFARGLILDGWPGWFYVFQRTIAEMLLALRLLIERQRLEPNEKAEH